MRTRAAHLRLGRRGEDIACRLLESKGHEILARNYRKGRWELDIVARDGLNLVFVEVKTRRGKSSGRPAAGLSQGQKYRIYRAALSYMREIGKPAIPYRFDLIELMFEGRKLVELRHWLRHFGRESVTRSSS